MDDSEMKTANNEIGMEHYSTVFVASQEMKRLHFILFHGKVASMDKSLQTETTVSKSAGRPKASDAEARMHELVHIAGTLFLKHGYTKVSLEAIAREAHVAVRTIYVKFGGKSGLLSAALEQRRDRFFGSGEMLADQRPLKQIVDGFGLRFLDLMASPDVIAMQRVVMTEAAANPELAETFYKHGPRRTNDMLTAFFRRADIHAQLRDGVTPEQAARHLVSCVKGDQLRCFLFARQAETEEENVLRLHQRLDLFYHGVLRQP
jgi:TetR/AcrR family transcriptional repressor of mexJK operon